MEERDNVPFRVGVSQAFVRGAPNRYKYDYLLCDYLVRLAGECLWPKSFMKMIWAGIRDLFRVPAITRPLSVKDTV